MSAAKSRKAHILERISAEDPISVANLAETLGVSEMTIRRDLADLEREGLVKRVHGGAISSFGRSYEPPYALRHVRSTAAKQAIARAAAEMVMEGDSVALDVGSTVYEVARLLSRRRGLTIITPSVRVLSLFLKNRDVRTIVSGGVLRTGEESLVGDLACHAFRDLFVDKLFLGLGGIDAENGLSEYNWDDALVKRAMIRSAKQVIVVADSSKFGGTAFARIADIGDIHAVVTDQPPPEALARAFAARRVRVVIAKEMSSRGLAPIDEAKCAMNERT
ncbi:MAG TPA: DeoR/GlpR family DNA-binding transcription regulator [Roseiarcus sp.]|nr:DeoR/GlpR family DNA-binding transcription regulator [Roseiarcus sp.]